MPSEIYFSLLTTVSVEPLSACLITISFRFDLSERMASLSDCVRLLVVLKYGLEQVDKMAFSVSLRYFSKRMLSDVVGEYEDFFLNGSRSLFVCWKRKSSLTVL